MACQFKPYAMVDVETLKLNFNEHSGIRYNDSSGSSTISEEFPLLDNCKVSLSPSGDFFVVAHKRTLCILTAKWDSQEEDDVKTKFKVTWKGDPCHNESEEITTVMCLPLIMPNKSSRSASEQIDWTCIVVGFSSGHLRFYDEGGDLLLSEQIFEEPIVHLKCQSFHPSKTSTYDDYPEELYVTFRSTVAVIPGFALFQTLRACRNQLARVKANFSEHVTPPPLTLKKWSFVDQDRMRDCEVIGPSSSDMFDHLMTASIRGGFNTCYRSGAPKSTLVVAAGKGPFVGFQYALEGVEGRSVLTDVAQVVKSKFKGLFGSRSNDRQKSPAIEPPESLACRFGLCDFNREADKIVRSPNREYSAVTDALGRVTLVNNIRGIAVRMWKGYRKAQCGWLQIEEEEPSSRKSPKQLLRSVLFLVIYDPKKGVLEVWTVPNGVRVAVFSCSKKGRLLYTSHGLVGLSNAPVKWANKSLLPCVFLDPSGTLFQVIVPFHCALSDATSERAADLALLRKLKTVLRETELDEEQLAQEVGLLAAELKTAEVRKQMLVLLTSSRHVTVDALEGALGVFYDRASSDDSRSSDGSRQILLLSIQQLRNLISFYKFVHQQKERPPNYSSVVPQEGVSDLEAVCDVLTISEREVAALKSLMNLLDSPASTHSTPKREARVTFTERTSSGSSLVDFLACFDFGKTCKGTVAPHAVAIKRQIVPAKVSSLADLLFQGILYSELPMEVWQTEAACSAILPANLLQLAILFWLHRNVGKALEVEMIRFSEVVKAICMMEEVNSCDLSSLWSMVRVMLAESDQPFNALTAALVCRAVAVSLEKHGLKKHSKSPKKGQTSSDMSKDSEMSDETNSAGPSKEADSQAESRKSSTEWEDVSWDSVKWNLLIGRLEDIALLDLVLGQNPADLCSLTENSTVPCLRYEKPNISLYRILEKGKGAISEQVAKWLTSSGVDPKLLLDSSDIERSEKNMGLPNSPQPMDVDEPGPEDKSEIAIREGIPLVAEKGEEASTVSNPHARILDKICFLRRRFPYSLCGSALIANISWEFLLEWHKCPDRMDILNAVVTCLQVIPNMHIRQGVSSLMWTSHLKQRIEIASKIVSETHGNPKEKLCRKELQMSESQLTEFVETCLKFIESFIEASNLSEVMHPPGPGSVVNCCEDVWEYDEEMAVTSTPSLTALALVQPQASFDHLHLIHQLSVTMHMILALGLRGQQLTSIFSPAEWGIFFCDGNYTAPKDGQVATEPQLCQKRAQFLIRAVTGALQSMLASDPSHVADLSEGPCADMSTAMKWMGKCKDLAYTWQLPMDPIRRHQVFLLYSSGHDRLAEEIMPSVNKVELLAGELLLLCGQRLKLILDNSEDLMDTISNLDPMLTRWLYELNTVGVRQVSLADTALLATHVTQYLPEDHPEAEIATDLCDALQALNESVDLS